MALVDRHSLVNALSQSTDALLASQLVDEYISLERRFVLRDWEPAQLDGGQFCEIAARILYGEDSSNISVSKPFDDAIKYLENDQVSHAILPRHDALHLARVLRTGYKFRSQRGAVHISPTYSPNQMDSRFVLETVRWSFSEILRIFWRGDRELVAKAIRELLQFDAPAIGKFGDRLIVQRTDLSAEEEVLILLHFAGEQGMSRTLLGQHALVSPASVTRSLQALADPTRRQVIEVRDGNFQLTDLGSKRIRESLSEKLHLG